MKARRAGIVFILLTGLILLSIVPVRQFYSLLYAPMLQRNATETDFVIKKNSSASVFSEDLKKMRLIQDPFFFRMLIKIKGASESIKAGVYRIYPGESAADFLHRVIIGDVLTFKFVIIEGSQLAQLKSKLHSAAYLHYDPNAFNQFKDNHASAEGLFLADSYQYTAGADSESLLKPANDALKRKLAYEWQHRKTGLPYATPYDMLIAASILEKEAALASERKIISGIIVNRLRLNMRLQMDPTVIYALGPNFTGILKHADLAVDSAYNTYRNKGLPPTPIAMVGASAIEAAAQPDNTAFLYYVAKGDGSHIFSKTYQQQRRAINKAREGASE